VTESNTKSTIITAVITGAFTIVTGLATYWLTTKEPGLTFSVVGGPTLIGSAGSSKRIFVVEVRNTGRKEIAQTLVQLSLQVGELAEVAFEASPGVKLVEEKTQRQVEIRADLLNPGDFVKVSFLTALTSPNTEPKVVVRAPGVQALSEPKKSKGLFAGDKSSDWVLLLAAALGSVVGSVVVSTRRLISRKLGLKSSGTSIDQSEVGAFVCGVCGLFEESDQLRFAGSEISYRGIADYLRYRAFQASLEERSKYEIALRALLLNKAISTISLSTIREAIDVLAGEKMTDAEFEHLRHQAVREGDDPMAWRATVEDYVRSFHNATNPL
jgi:hypothetical protein